MVELLVKYKNKINWVNIDEWDYDGGFEYYENEDGSFSLHKVSNTSGYKIIRKNLLQYGRNYSITFDLEVVSGEMRFKSGSIPSMWYDTSGTYTFTGALSSNLNIESLDDGDEWYVSKLIIEEVGYTSLDLYEEPDILINFNVSDVRDYSKRLGNYTKNIRIPGSPKNNKYFDFLFDETIESRLSMLSKCDAIISNNGITILNGTIYVDEITKNREIEEYSLQFYGQQLNLFKDIGEDFLETLDFSSLNHELNTTNILNSWANFPLSSDYVYPWLDYGRDWGLGGEFGRMTDLTPSCGIVCRDFIPAISVKALIDKVFSTYGYTYDSDIFNSDQFKQLIIPYTNPFEELPQEWHVVSKAVFTGGPSNMTPWLCQEFEILNQDSAGGVPLTYLQDWIDGYFTENVKSSMKDGIPSYYYVEGYTPHIMDVDTELYRQFNYGPFLISNQTEYELGSWVASLPGGYCTTSNPNNYQRHTNHIPGSYLVPHDGKYRITIKYRINQNDHGASVNTWKGVRLWASKIKQDDVITDNISFGSSQYAYVDNNWSFVDGATDHPVPIGGAAGTPGYHEYTTDWITASVEMDCEAGDELFVKFRGNYTVFAGQLAWIQIEEYGYGEGITQDMNKILPKETTIKAFIKDLIQMFNLYIDVDVNDAKNLLINTRDVFYSGTTIRDWSQKLDLNYDISMVRPTDYQSLLNRYKFKEAKDYANIKYNEEKDVQKVGYGGKRFIFENDVIDGEKITSLSVFAPTVMNDIWNVNGDGNKPQFVVSNLWNATYPKTDPINYTFKTEWTPRIIYFNNIPIGFNTITQRKFNFNGSTTHANAGNYPYCGHILNPFDLTGSTNYDIHFETPISTNGTYQKQFTGAPYNTMTTNNLWNLYHYNAYKQMTHKDSRLMTAYFYLTDNDIVDLTMGDVIEINNLYYTINKICDFNPVANGSTKVELLKVLRTTDLPIASYEDDGGIFPRPPVNLNDFDSQIDASNIVGDEGGGTIISGDVNVVIGAATRSALINSSYNQVKSPSTILNSNFVNVAKSISGSTIINENNITISEPGVYIDGIKVKSGYIMENNDVVDGGYIEDDGVLNEMKYMNYHINDANYPADDFAIDANIVEDGGII